MKPKSVKKTQLLTGGLGDLQTETEPGSQMCADDDDHDDHQQRLQR
jgi:hypothetical protein